MNKFPENINLIEENKRKNEKAIEEIRKGQRYNWVCPYPDRTNCLGCPYFKMSHPVDRCLNREKWIQTKEGMELTDNQKEQLGIKDNSQRVIKDDNLSIISQHSSVAPVDSNPIIEKAKTIKHEEEKSLDRLNGGINENKKFNKTQILFIILIGLVALGIGLLSYFATNNYFHSSLNSTLVDNSTCIMPTIPACPVNTCNCPSPNLTLNLPTSLVNLINQSISNSTNHS